MRKLIFGLAVIIGLSSCSRENKYLYVFSYETEQVNIFGEPTHGSHNAIYKEFIEEEYYECTLYSYYLCMKEALKEDSTYAVARRVVKAYEEDPAKVKLRFNGLTDRRVSSVVIPCNDTYTVDSTTYSQGGSIFTRTPSNDDGDADRKLKWSWFGSTIGGI